MVCAALVSCTHTTHHYANSDSARVESSDLVLRVNVLGGGEGSKYQWQPVRVMQIIKKPEAVFIPEQMKIAALSTAAGLPSGQTCTVYLERYDPSHPESGWKLIESSRGGTGSESAGFSHVENQQAEQISEGKGQPEKEN